MKHLLLLAAAGLLLASCRKADVIVCDPTPADSLSLADFTRRNSAPVQAFSLAVGTTTTLTTQAGTTLVFPGNGFILPSGAAATGTAEVRVREIRSVPEMVLANMPTTVAVTRQLLVSGGEFSIQVWQGASRLRLKFTSTPLGTATGLALQTPIRAEQDITPQLLWQQPAKLLASPISDSTGWVLRDTLRAQVPSFYRTLIPLDSIGWWNIDQLWHRYLNNTTVEVQVATPATEPGDTRVFLRPVGYNGLARLPSPVAGSARTRWAYSLPIGVEMIAVVLQSVQGQLYYGTQRLTSQSGLVVTPPLVAVSEAEAVRLIRQL
ncbi:hypothetical protein QMK33_13240 [Hymenobacter sp. H14-R3]|uniref:hypothetical protein n=1 Tax=Hymenobacter sp. H14-R3 TaxID=3046308 RepID=UPI0024B9CFB6|nr:hypothetical protein [Hymenobacter sp. H14-R3]MDJ0366120.1 hypothetical protein [Hymenobacter sp. H14-R3]